MKLIILKLLKKKQALFILIIILTCSIILPISLRINKKKSANKVFKNGWLYLMVYNKKKAKNKYKPEFNNNLLLNNNDIKNLILHYFYDKKLLLNNDDYIFINNLILKYLDDNKLLLNNEDLKKGFINFYIFDKNMNELFKEINTGSAAFDNYKYEEMKNIWNTYSYNHSNKLLKALNSTKNVELFFSGLEFEQLKLTWWIKFGYYSYYFDIKINPETIKNGNIKFFYNWLNMKI
jgi:hypothetical protein